MLMSPVHAALAAITYLLVKHAVADFILQTETRSSAKRVSYGAPGGLWHALIHILLTAPVFLLFPGGGRSSRAGFSRPNSSFTIISTGRKSRSSATKGWTPKDKYFWWALGIDQLLHGLTYVAILWIWLPAD